MFKIMNGKKGVIMGVANDHSIAWGISKALADAGAQLAFTYQGDALEKRVRPLVAQLGSNLLIPCDVSNPESMDKAFEIIKEEMGEIDFIVHAIAFSDKNELKGRFVDTTKENFTNTMLISCFSFVDVAKRASALMKNGGSILTLSYFGAEKWIPHYNVMGVAKAALESSVYYLASDLGKDNIRVNAISAGPIKTLAAAGIGDFRFILGWNELNSPLRKNVTIEEVGDSAVYLLSDMAKAVTGEIHHVDAGFNSVGMVAVDNAQQSAELLNSVVKK